MAQKHDRYSELRDAIGKPVRLIGVKIDAEAILNLAHSLPVEWVSAHRAIDMLLPMYGKGAGYVAAKALAKRTHSGLVKSRAALFKRTGETEYRRRPDLSGAREARMAPVPKAFWWAEGEQALEQNWITGDFATWIDSTYYWQAFGVEFASSDVAAMLPKRIVADVGTSESQQAEQGSLSNDTRVGRSAAKWWPAFAEELAVYLFECGLPPGDGTQGQSKVIDQVFERLTQAGRDEPSRTTVQPVISAVLRRSRSAGK